MHIFDKAAEQIKTALSSAGQLRRLVQLGDVGGYNHGPGENHACCSKSILQAGLGTGFWHTSGPTCNGFLLHTRSLLVIKLAPLALSVPDISRLGSSRCSPKIKIPILIEFLTLVEGFSAYDPICHTRAFDRAVPLQALRSAFSLHHSTCSSS